MNPSASPVPAPARLFDGRSARAHPVRVWFLPDSQLVVQDDRLELRHAAREISLDRRLADTPRFLRLPGGRTCEFTDQAALDAALSSWPAATGLRSHALGWKFTVGALLALALAAWLFISQGMPFAARQAAFMLPANTTEKISEGSLADMDATVFEPSRLPGARRDAFLRRARVFLNAVGEPPDRRIEFRSSPEIGANAMALPSGVIVFTDDIVLLATNDEQLLGVLAHECGHLHHRHALRGILQNSAVAMMLTLVTGKQRSANSLQAGLTAHLIDSRYSRDFEYEADAYAAVLLRRAKIPVARLGEMLDLLEQQAGAGPRAQGTLNSYLMSHPTTPERIRRLETE